jgi:hypothetical protein
MEGTEKKKKKVLLFLASMRAGTGNLTSMSRLTGFLEEYEVKELDANAYKNAQAFYEETKHFNAHVLVGKEWLCFFSCAIVC